MYVIHATSVDGALAAGLRLLEERGLSEASRAGPVTSMQEPVTTVWVNPTRRVSLCPVRDANPFFHLVEAAWMLAGGRRPQLLDEYIRDFSSRFSEPTGEQHGAYGHRWRYAFGIDQLDACVEMLRRDPTSRRAVLQMWDCTHDQFDDLAGDFLDHPCNTHAYLRVRQVEWLGPVLDLTVCCRSNDLIWGAYGANVVHFSVLLEYLAARIGVGVGRYYQISNNLHVYDREMERLEARAWKAGRPIAEPATCPDPLPIVSEPTTFDRELATAMDVIVGRETPAILGELRNVWLCDTLYRAVSAFRTYRARFTRMAVLDAASLIQSPDWRMACTNWLERRTVKWG